MSQKLGTSMITDRLIAVRHHFGLSQSAIAERVGVSANTWNGYEKQATAPNPKALSKLAEDGINVNWLLTGKGEMLDPDGAGGADDDLVYIPRYDALVAAGSGAIPIEHPTSTPVAFSKRWLREELRVTPSGLFLIEARGDSMTGLIDNGDVLLIDTNEPKMAGDGIYVFSVDGMLLVKQLRSRLNGDIDVFDGEGNLQQTLDRKDLAAVQVVGRVIWKAGRT